MSVKNFSFPLECRLTEKHSFNNVFAKPACAKKTASFSILATESKLTQGRLGIVVAKRNIRLAVNRNRIKRLIRETFRQQQRQLGGLDFVVVVRRDFANQASERDKLTALFARIGVEGSGDAKKISNF